MVKVEVNILFFCLYNVGTQRNFTDTGVKNNSPSRMDTDQLTTDATIAAGVVGGGLFSSVIAPGGERCVVA